MFEKEIEKLHSKELAIKEEKRSLFKLVAMYFMQKYETDTIFFTSERPTVEYIGDADSDIKGSYIEKMTFNEDGSIKELYINLYYDCEYRTCDARDLIKLDYAFLAEFIDAQNDGGRVTEEEYEKENE